MQAYQVNKALSVRHKHDFFMTEVKNGPTQYGSHLRRDAVAIKKSWEHQCIIIYEVKVSRGDFKQDDKWHLYRQYGNTFSFAVPEGLIDKSELPDGVGLYYVKDNGSIRTVVKPRFYDVKPDSSFLLYIIMNRLDSDKLEFFSDKYGYYKEWLEAKKTKQLVGKEVSNQLNKSIKDHEKSVKTFHDNKKDVDETIVELKKIVKDLNDHGFNVSTWSNSYMLSQLRAMMNNPIHEVERAVKNRIADIENLKSSCLGALKSIGYDLEKEVYDIEKNRNHRLRGKDTQLSIDENFHII